MYFKFTRFFQENEEFGLMELFPDLDLSHTYEVLNTEYMSDEDDLFGITKIKSVESKAVFDIDEVKTTVDGGLWCFICSDIQTEYEVVQCPSE